MRRPHRLQAALWAIAAYWEAYKAFRAAWAAQGASQDWTFDDLDQALRNDTPTRGGDRP